MAELQKSGVFLDKSETPPNSNSRDFKIVQIFGIEITAGISQSVTLLVIDSALWEQAVSPRGLKLPPFNIPAVLK